MATENHGPSGTAEQELVVDGQRATGSLPGTANGGHARDGGSPASGARRRDRQRSEGRSVGESDDGETGTPEELLKKLLSGEINNRPADEAARKKWPWLFELIAFNEGLDDKLEDFGGLSIYVRGGGYQVTLRNPATNRQTRLLSLTLGTVFDDLEGLLRSGKAIWEPIDKRKEADRRKKLKNA